VAAAVLPFEARRRIQAPKKLLSVENAISAVVENQEFSFA
jgi:hypothetical protein